MKVINISSRNLKRKRELYISSKIVNTEARLYIHESKQNYLPTREILKVFYNQSNQFIAEKMATIGKINALFEEKDFPELVLPKALVSVDGNIAGYSMDFIEDNVNLVLLLKNPKIKLDIKIKLLKMIQAILLRIMNNPELKDKFFLGDIHEANFLWDISSQMIKGIDLDSSYVVGGGVPIMKFATYNPKLENIPNKFTFDKNGMVIPNQNTVNLNFLMMLLNTISGEDAYRWDEEMYYSYLGYLGKLKFPKELLVMLANLYTPGHVDIENPELLSCIDTRKNYTLSRIK